VGGKLEEADKNKLKQAVDEAIKWLDDSQEASKDEYETRQKELEETANPIMMKLYGQAGGQAGGPGGFPGGAPPSGGADAGPTVEEVD